MEARQRTEREVGAVFLWNVDSAHLSDPQGKNSLRNKGGWRGHGNLCLR
ncbi:hypothetical protein T261_1586 [Streptomyces lydicus]|nr:hypothetical protein T261_1586 [Streptomyces lydicus]